MLGVKYIAQNERQRTAYEKAYATQLSEFHPGNPELFRTDTLWPSFERFCVDTNDTISSSDLSAALLRERSADVLTARPSRVGLKQMTRTIVATAVALALSGAMAYAGSDAYPAPVARPLFAQQVRRDTGSENYPTFGPGQVQVIAGGSGLLPADGSDGIIQSDNSVPASTIYGTTAFANAAHGKVSRQVAVDAKDGPMRHRL